MLREGNCTPLPAWEKKIPSAYKSAVMQQVALSGKRVAQGKMDLPTEGRVNNFFPEMATLTIREALQIYYGQ